MCYGILPTVLLAGADLSWHSRYSHRNRTRHSFPGIIISLAAAGNAANTVPDATHSRYDRIPGIPPAGPEPRFSPRRLIKMRNCAASPINDRSRSTHPLTGCQLADCPMEEAEEYFFVFARTRDSRLHVKGYDRYIQGASAAHCYS